jgi:hypothetical protein
MTTPVIDRAEKGWSSLAVFGTDHPYRSDFPVVRNLKFSAPHRGRSPGNRAAKKWPSECLPAYSRG